MKIPSVDIGGSHIKTLLSGESPEDKRRVESGHDFTPDDMVAAIREMRSPDEFDVMAIGLPAPIRGGRLLVPPKNLGPGWESFDFQSGFPGKPIRLLNDAAMQAVGSYSGGKMLFLGLGTGLGSCMICNHQVMPMEVAHMPFKNDDTFEDRVGEANRAKEGTKHWRTDVWKMVGILHQGLLPETICIGGGNAKRLAKHMDEVPGFVTLGENTNAFLGGFRVWEEPRFEESVPILGKA